MAPVARVVDTASLDAAQLPNAVLTECHGPLRGQMDRVKATITTADGKEIGAYAAFPARFRVQDDSGQYLARGEDVLRIGGNQPAAPAAAADRTRVLELRRLVDAAALGPLHRATGCRRLGPAEFELTQPDGTSRRMTLRSQSLLPSAFHDSTGEVTLLEWRLTSATWLVTIAATPTLGPCRVQFNASDMAWSENLFEPPEVRPTPTLTQQVTDPGVVAERQSATPILVESKVFNQVVMPDPGEWPARTAAYLPLHAELERQDQMIAGFPQLWQQDGQRWLAATFRRRADGPALQAPAGWQLREIPAGRWLVVYPAEGDFAARVAAGERLLEAALRERTLRVRGPVLAQPFLHLEEGEPPPAALLSPKVRVAVPVH